MTELPSTANVGSDAIGPRSPFGASGIRAPSSDSAFPPFANYFAPNAPAPVRARPPSEKRSTADDRDPRVRDDASRHADESASIADSEAAPRHTEGEMEPVAGAPTEGDSAERNGEYSEGSADTAAGAVSASDESATHDEEEAVSDTIAPTASGEGGPRQPAVPQPADALEDASTEARGGPTPVDPTVHSADARVSTPPGGSGPAKQLGDARAALRSTRDAVASNTHSRDTGPRVDTETPLEAMDGAVEPTIEGRKVDGAADVPAPKTAPRRTAPVGSASAEERSAPRSRGRDIPAEPASAPLPKVDGGASSRFAPQADSPQPTTRETNRRGKAKADAVGPNRESSERGVAGAAPSKTPDIGVPVSDAPPPGTLDRAGGVERAAAQSGGTASAAVDGAPRPAPRFRETAWIHSGGRESGQGPSLTPAEHQRFEQRVSRALEMARHREGAIRLRLSPPELGSLRLELRVEQGVVHARLEAETRAARQLLAEHLPALRDRLEEQGMRVAEFDIGTMDHHDPSARHGGGERTLEEELPGRPPPRPRGADTTGNGGESEVEPRIARPASIDGRGLNIIV